MQTLLLCSALLSLSLTFCSRIALLPFFLKSSQKPYVLSLCCRSSVIHSAVLFLFILSHALSGISCSATSSDIWWYRANSGEETAHSVCGVLCHSAELVGLKSTRMFEWTCAKAVVKWLNSCTIHTFQSTHHTKIVLINGTLWTTAHTWGCWADYLKVGSLLYFCSIVQNFACTLHYEHRSDAHLWAADVSNGYEQLVAAICGKRL